MDVLYVHLLRTLARRGIPVKFMDVLYVHLLCAMDVIYFLWMSLLFFRNEKTEGLASVFLGREFESVAAHKIKHSDPIDSGLPH